MAIKQTDPPHFMFMFVLNKQEVEYNIIIYTITIYRILPTSNHQAILSNVNAENCKRLSNRVISASQVL